MTYQFIIDQKCTIWVREYHEIEADSQEQANELMKREFSDGNHDTFMHQETMYDTIEDLSVDENGGWSTRELMDGDGSDLITNNAENFKTTIQ